MKTEMVNTGVLIRLKAGNYINIDLQIPESELVINVQGTTPLPANSPTSIPTSLRTPKPYPERQTVGGEGVAHSIKQITDTDGEPMIQVVVNSDCSAADMDAIHEVELQKYAIAEDLDEWENETGLWTVYRQDQDGLSTAIMGFNNRGAAEEALAGLNASEQQIAPTSQTIGFRIHQRRTGLGIQARILADKLRLSTECIADWEEESCPVEADYIIPLAKALECDPMWLLSGIGMTATNEAPLAPVEVMQGVDMAGVGKRIRECRVSRRMTYEELENAARLPQGVTSVWESGKAYPPAGAFDKLAPVLRTSVTWLLTGREIARES